MDQRKHSRFPGFLIFSVTLLLVTLFRSMEHFIFQSEGVKPEETWVKKTKKEMKEEKPEKAEYEFEEKPGLKPLSKPEESDYDILKKKEMIMEAEMPAGVKLEEKPEGKPAGIGKGKKTKGKQKTKGGKTGAKGEDEGWILSMPDYNMYN